MEKPSTPPPPYHETEGSVNPGYAAVDIPPYHGTVNSWQPHANGAQEPSVDPAAAEVGFSSRGLDDVTVRRSFIRKVYLILTCQLGFTFTIVLLATMVMSLRTFLQTNLWLFYASIAVFVVIYVALVCSTKLRRQTPGNYIAMCVFTLAMTLMTSTLAAFFTTNAVMVSLGITAGVCIGVTLFTLQSRVDLSLIAGLVFGVMLAFTLFAIACLITFLTFRGLDPLTARLLDCVYGGLVALLLAVCLLVDTHRVIGSGNGYELSPEEYIFGALQLYIDIVYIFILILGIRGGR